MPWTIQDISELDPNGTYSVADYRAWPVEQTAHIIKRNYYPVKLGADLVHGKIRMALLVQLDGQLRGHKQWRDIHAPMDVYLPLPDTVVQPDYLICDRSLLNDWVFGIPAWMCEIVNQDSWKLDTITKKALYAEAGVPEYMIVYPYFNIVEVYHLQDGRYGDPEIYEEPGQTWELSSVPGVWLKYDEIFIES